MPHLIIPRDWRQAPSGLLRVDRNNSLSEKLEFLIAGQGGTATPFDLARPENLPLGTGSNYGLERGIRGAGDVFTGVSSGYYRRLNDRRVGWPFTMFGLMYAASSTACYAIPGIAFYKNGTGSYGVGTWSNSSGANWVRSGGDGGLWNTNSTDNSVVARPRFTILSVHGVNEAYVYVDGRQVGTYTGTFYEPDSTWYIGTGYVQNRNFTNTAGSAELRIAFAGLLSRSVSEAEAAEWGANPWQLFKPRTARIYSFPSGSAGQNISPTGIGSGESVGSATVSTGAVSAAPAGIASAEAHGSPTVTVGATQVAPGGVASVEAHGTPTISVGQVAVASGGISSAESVGAAVVAAAGVMLQPSAIASTEAHGTHAVVPGAASVVPTGIASAESVGSHTLLQGTTVAPAGIASVEAAGSHTASAGAVNVGAGGIASGEAVGAHVVSAGASLVAPPAVTSGESVTTPTLYQQQLLGPTGVASSEAAGAPSLTVGTVFLAPSGIGSAFAAGAHTLSGGVQAVGWLRAQARLRAALRARARIRSALRGNARIR